MPPPWRLHSAGAPRFAAAGARFLSTHHPTGLDEAGPLACRLRSRSVIRLRGPDTLKFLQNLLTNDVRPLSLTPNSAEPYLPAPNALLLSPPPIYAAMLNPEGRFLYDLFLYRQPVAAGKLDSTGSEPRPEEDQLTVLADVDAAVSDELLLHLGRSRLRAKIEIENATKEFSCWQRFGSKLANNDSEIQEPEAASVGWGMGADHAGESAAQVNSVGWKWFKDPRLDILGFRGVFPSDMIPPLVESDKETEERNYLLWRLERGVAEGSVEIPKGEAIPLEYNLAGLNAISFNKGCYTGQELVARTHHRGVIRKRLLPLKFVYASGQEVEQVSPGLDVVESTSNKKVGRITTALGCRGMGLLRVAEVFKQSPPALSINEKDDVRVEVIKPAWWPAEWLSA